VTDLCPKAAMNAAGQFLRAPARPVIHRRICC
jgi:hypothetical protein